MSTADGLCIMDVAKSTHFAVGTASFNDIYDAAYFLVHECVMGEEVGGLADKIGKSSSLLATEPIFYHETAINEDLQSI